MSRHEKRYLMTIALELKQLKTYPGGVQALRGIDLQVEAGDFYALLGPNGAGKSTTIGIISSLVNKTSGQVNVFGYDLEKTSSTPSASLARCRRSLTSIRSRPCSRLSLTVRATTAWNAKKLSPAAKIPKTARSVGKTQRTRADALRRDEASPDDRPRANA